jgi:hypothetical protein
MPAEIQQIIDGIVQQTGPYLPRIGAALAILIIGFLVAVLLSWLVRAVVRATGLGGLIGRWLRRGEAAPPPPVDRWAGTAVFYTILLLAAIAAIQALNITIITEPLRAMLTGIFGYLPQLIGAAILVLLAWLLATVLRFVVREALDAFNINERVSGQARDADSAQGDGSSAAAQAPIPLSQILGDVVYWLVFLLFLPAILGALGLAGLLAPVQSLVGEVLAFLPNVIAAGLILLIGWFVAGIVRRLVTNLLVAAGADRLSERMGLAGALGEQRLSGLIGLIVYALILIPVILAALNALALDALTEPTSNMLTILLQAIPAILAAAIVLAIAYFVGRIVAELVTNLLTGVGFNNLPARLGMDGAATIGGRTPSQVVGYLVLVAFMVVAAMWAADLMGFALLGQLLGQFIEFASQIIFGIIVFGIGFLVASLVARLIIASNVTLAGLWAMVARVAILFLAGAIALRAMGFANEIIILAFGLPLAAIAVAIAVAFGVGGREIAARELDNLIQAIRRRT